MNKLQIIEGFAKLNRKQKIQALAEIIVGDKTYIKVLEQFWFKNGDTNFNLEGVSENIVSHYFLPYSIAPNFKVNGKIYFVPMVTEESSVVAAASSAAKFWLNKGGFNARVISTTKIGQIHFTWPGAYQNLVVHFPSIKEKLKESVSYYLVNMKKRGGGIIQIELVDYTDKLHNYYQIRVSFETVDAMGANLINSCLEEMAKMLKHYISYNFGGNESHCDIIMSILSNHTPDCLVECTVSCKIDQFNTISKELTAYDFVDKFRYAVGIANIDIYRAATHNKGIFNGIDAVTIATGNDFRAVEAGGHAYAAKDGRYKSLTHIEIDNDIFKYTLKIPLAIGTVGGLTSIHPLARISLEIIGNPSAQELMQIVSSVGLANNFSAIRALISSGIQKGHMKLHLNNILNSLKANGIERKEANHFFKERTVSFAEVQTFINDLRK